MAEGLGAPVAQLTAEKRLGFLGDAEEPEEALSTCYTLLQSNCIFMKFMV